MNWITPADARLLVQKNQALLFDVREKDEVTLGVAEGAKWIPLSKLQASPLEWQKFVSQLPKDRPVIFYCAGGIRSGYVVEDLENSGWPNALNMGGYSDWVSSRLPISMDVTEADLTPKAPKP